MLPKYSTHDDNFNLFSQMRQKPLWTFEGVFILSAENYQVFSILMSIFFLMSLKIRHNPVCFLMRCHMHVIVQRKK